MPQWNRLKKMIENLGGRIIGVTADTPGNTAEFKRLRKIDFDLISEPACSLANYLQVILFRSKEHHKIDILCRFQCQRTRHLASGRVILLEELLPSPTA